MCASKTRDIAHASDLFHQFLNEQDKAYRALQAQYPGEAVDLYRDRIEDLLANLNVLMYYRISPEQLDSLLKLKKAHRDFKLLDEPGLALEVYGKAVENLQILLYRHGQLNTFRTNRPVNPRGEPIPWITYPAFEFLSQFDYAQSTVFEFGSGNSTLFWAERALSVTSVETDRDWFEALQRNIPSNVQLSYFDDADQFANSIMTVHQVFDVVVIDSAKHRYRAALNTVETIADGGMVIFDNSDWYPNSCRLLREHGFVQIDFHGFGPVNNYAWTTSVFFRGSMKFRRLAEDLRPIGGIVAQASDDTP